MTKPHALPAPERAELQRQGAKAAARGDAANSNPLLKPQNRPEASGESPAVWSQRCRAWQQGHSVQSDATQPPEGTSDSKDHDGHE